MRIIVAVGLIGSTIAPTSLAFAANFPSHAAICLDENGNKSTIVSKERLAKELLKADSAASKLYIDVDTVNPNYKYKWQAIFDKSFCATDRACFAPATDSADSGQNPAGGSAKPGGKSPPPTNDAANAVLRELREEAADSIRTATTHGGLYSTDTPKIGIKYFLSGPSEYPIHCVGEDPPPAPKPFVIKMPSQLRLRANSDDLRYDASGDAVSKASFQGAKPAMVSYTADSIQGTRVTSLQAALGYAIPLSLGDTYPTGFSYLAGELVPFISANESISKSNGKLATLADTNVVAVGSLINAISAFEDWAGVTHVLTAKPQYVWNTKDKSEIAKNTFIYTPYTTWGLTINTPNQIGDNPNALTLLFNLRGDFGNYTEKGIDPVAARMHTSFDRAGSQFGFIISSDPNNGAHITLNVTETMLYGFVGSIKRLDYLVSSLTYYFDSTSNFGFSLTYTKGTNEDTNQRTQNYMASLSAKF